MSKDFRKLYLGVKIFKHYFEDTGLQRYPLSTKDFCNFFYRIINLKSTIFLLVHFSIFGDLDWEGSNGDPKSSKKKHYKILGTILAYFIYGVFNIANRNFGVL